MRWCMEGRLRAPTRSRDVPVRPQDAPARWWRRMKVECMESYGGAAQKAREHGGDAQRGN